MHYIHRAAVSGNIPGADFVDQLFSVTVATSDAERKMSERSTNTDPTVVLVLGILSFVFCQLLGPVAVYMGLGYRKECSEAGIQPEATGTIGLVMGAIGSFQLVLLIGILAIYMVMICAGIGFGIASEM